MANLSPEATRGGLTHCDPADVMHRALLQRRCRHQHQPGTKPVRRRDGVTDGPSRRATGADVRGAYLLRGGGRIRNGNDMEGLGVVEGVKLVHIRGLWEGH